MRSGAKLAELWPYQMEMVDRLSDSGHSGLGCETAEQYLKVHGDGIGLPEGI